MPIRFIDRRAILGRVSTSIDGAAGLIQGSHTRPPDRVGAIGAALDSAICGVTGTFTPTANRSGTIATTLDGASAALAGTFAQSGALTDDGAFVINGSGFGSPSATRLWTGGANSAAELAALDTPYTNISPASFKMAAISSPNNLWRVSSQRRYGSRQHSYLWDTTDSRNNTAANVGQATMVWNPGLAQLGSFYFAFKIYLDVPQAATDLQMKTLRLISQYVAEGASGINDGEGNNCLLSNRMQNGTSQSRFWQGYFGANPSGVHFPPFGSTATYFGDSGWPDTGTIATYEEAGWYEVEVECRDQTTMSSSDAMLSHRLRRLSDGAIVASHVRNNVQIYPGTGTRFKYLAMQMGGFNGAGSGINEGGNCKVSLLDIYGVVNSRARVRLSNNSNFASATVSELCENTAWSDTQIRGKINKGGHATLAGPLFYHVWNDAGVLINPVSTLQAA